MPYLKRYIKQSENGIVSHVYEHVILDYVTKQLSRKGYQTLLDYEVLATTEDGIIVVRFESTRKQLFKTFEKLLNYSGIDTPAIKRAVEQIQCEYERTHSIEMTKLIRMAKKMTTQPWKTMEELGFTQPVTDDSRDLMTSIGGFGRRNTKSFDHHVITYTINDCPYELKTLAVYIVQIVGLMAIERFNHEIQYCYDSGDEWAEYQDLVGYAHKVTSLKSRKVTTEQLRSLIDVVFEDLTKKKSQRRILRYIYRDISQPFSYFDPGHFFARSYQLAGIAGMRQVTTTENILTILKKIKIIVEKV